MLLMLFIRTQMTGSKKNMSLQSYDSMNSLLLHEDA